MAPAVTAVVAPGEDAENADDKADEATSDHFDLISPTAAVRAKRNVDISSSSDADSDKIKGRNGKECAEDPELAGLTSLLEKTSRDSEFREALRIKKRRLALKEMTEAEVEERGTEREKRQMNAANAQIFLTIMMKS